MSDDFSDWEEAMKNLGVKTYGSKPSKQKVSKNRSLKANQSSPVISSSPSSTTSSTPIAQANPSLKHHQIPEENTGMKAVLIPNDALDNLAIPNDNRHNQHDLALEDWLLLEDQKKFSHFEEQIHGLEKDKEELRLQHLNDQKQIDILQEEIQKMRQQLTLTTQELEDQRLGFLAQVEHQANQNSILTKEHQEMLQKVADVQQQIESQIAENSIQQSFLKACVGRGFLKISQQAELLQKLSTHAIALSLIQRAQVSPEFQNFLKDEVLLVGSHIQDPSTIQGITISVEPEQCEISQGHPIVDDIREVVTEILLQGWRNFLILGLPKRTLHFVRTSLGQPSIDIQVDVRGHQWLENADMTLLATELNKYPAVMVFGSIELSSKATLFQYPHQSLGKAFSQLRHDIANFMTETDVDS